jgi:apolipoprotein N-acyltransferase
MALIPLQIGIRDAAPLRAASLTWFIGLVATAGGCPWWISLLGRFANLSVPGSSAIAILVYAYSGAILALWALLCSVLARRARVPWLVSGPLAIGLVEGLWPTAFPWYLGALVSQAWPVVQVAELGGPPAVSAVVVLVNVLLADLLRERRVTQISIRVRLAMGIVALALVAGWCRGLHVQTIRQAAPHLRIGLVQPNVGIASVKDRARNGRYYIATLRAETAEVAGKGAELIVWPESAWPYLFSRRLRNDYPAGHPWEFSPGLRVRLLVGVLSHDFGTADVWNSAVLFSESGRIVGRYDKRRLMPFGEYIPLATTFPSWAERVRARLPEWPTVLPATDASVLVDGPVRIASLICSEDMHADLLAAQAAGRPNLLASLANDAWFGTSAAPWQHFALAMFRAVESRRDLVRATNTGVSGVIDATGRVVVEGGLASVLPGETAAPAHLLAHVALLDAFALGPYAVRLFPYACLIGLAAAAAVQTRKVRKPEAGGSRRSG